MGSQNSFASADLHPVSIREYPPTSPVGAVGRAVSYETGCIATADDLWTSMPACPPDFPEDPQVCIGYQNLLGLHQQTLGRHLARGWRG